MRHWAPMLLRCHLQEQWSLTDPRQEKKPQSAAQVIFIISSANSLPNYPHYLQDMQKKTEKPPTRPNSSDHLYCSPRNHIHNRAAAPDHTSSLQSTGSKRGLHPDRPSPGSTNKRIIHTNSTNSQHRHVARLSSSRKPHNQHFRHSNWRFGDNPTQQWLNGETFNSS